MGSGDLCTVTTSSSTTALCIRSWHFIGRRVARDYLLAGCLFSGEQWLLPVLGWRSRARDQSGAVRKRRDTLWQSGRRHAHEHCAFCSWERAVYRPSRDAFSHRISAGWGDEQNSQPVTSACQREKERGGWGGALGPERSRAMAGLKRSVKRPVPIFGPYDICCALHHAGFVFPPWQPMI
jgi:hypothetical protein